MPKGKILMGETTPGPRGSADKINGERIGRYIGDLKGNFYSVDPKTGKQTLITAGPKTKKLPPKPTPVKPKPKPKPTPDPYGFPPAEGFGGYSTRTNKLIPMRTPIVKKAPKRVSVTRKGGK